MHIHGMADDYTGSATQLQRTNKDLLYLVISFQLKYLSNGSSGLPVWISLCVSTACGWGITNAIHLCPRRSHVPRVPRGALRSTLGQGSSAIRYLSVELNYLVILSHTWLCMQLSIHAMLTWINVHKISSVANFNMAVNLSLANFTGGWAIFGVNFHGTRLNLLLSSTSIHLLPNGII